MITAHRLIITLMVMLFSLGTSMAQTPPTNQLLTSTVVTATASSQRVRYISVGEVNHTRLQVFSSQGAQVYDSGMRLGNLVEWQLGGRQSASATDGSYLFLVTVKDFSGNITQKYGSAILERGEVYLEQTSVESLPPAQVAALEANKLSDVFSVVDRVGVAALDRTSTAGSAEDTSITTASTPGTGETSETSANEVSATGTGTQNRIAKWIDDAGTLGDSVMFDNGVGVGVGTTDLTDVLVAGNDKFKIVDGNMTFSFRDFSGGQGYFAVGSSANGIKGFVGHTNTTDGFTLGTFSAHKLTIRTNSVNRLTIDTLGRVGIGLHTPTSTLHVNGHVHFRGFRTDQFSNVIGGSEDNTLSPGVLGGTIGGGGGFDLPNRVMDNHGTVAGGWGNTAGGGSSQVNDGSDATVGGGRHNTASGMFSTVPGGYKNVAQGERSFAAGSRARALHDGSFVWSDSTLLDPNFFASTGANQFLINATGGVGIGTNAPGAGTRLHVAGGNLFIAQPNSLIITSPNGTCWFITVNNAGALSTFSVACP